MKVKRPLANILQAFSSNASANESYSIYAEILEFYRGLRRMILFFEEGGHVRIRFFFPGLEVEGLTILPADARGIFW